jgi:hypothetical protein
MLEGELGPFAYAEKTSWNIVSADLCEIKTLFWLKNMLKSTDYKPAEQGVKLRLV